MEIRNLIPQTNDYGILTRDEFLEEFDYRYAPGQHVVGVGPTGRGKTTLFGRMLPFAKTNGTIISCLGRDDALCHMGKPYHKHYWPPRTLSLQRYDEPKYIRRIEGLPRTVEDFPRIRRVNSQVLRWMFGRSDWTLFFPDLQLITDPRMMNLGKEVEQLLLTLRKAKSSVWMDAQAPRWIPRAATDQVTHLMIWRNRDIATMKRLREIAGLDVNMMEEMFGRMTFHDALWVDVKRDEYFIVYNDDSHSGG